MSSPMITRILGRLDLSAFCWAHATPTAVVSRTVSAMSRTIAFADMNRTLIECCWVQICRYIELELPDDVEREEVHIVCRVMPLQCSGERSAASTVGSGTRVHKLPRGASRYVAVDLIFYASAISHLPINSHYPHPLPSRER